MIDPKTLFHFTGLDENAVGHFSASWLVPVDLPYFDGHFPGNPVLPAVAILDATVELVARSLGTKQLTLTAVKSAKFMAPIAPGNSIEISVHHISEKQWRAEWRNNELPNAQNLVAALTLSV